MTRSDTLVLELIENNPNGVEQLRAFVLYDHILEQFLVRGGYQFHGSQDLSFYCDNMESMETFIELLFGNFDDLRISLLNIKHLSTISDEITYDILRDNNGIKNEIVSYNYYSPEHKYCKKRVHNHLKVLQNVYNDYF
jgi:hypothetical protein